MPDDRVWGWIWPLVITAFAAFLRFNRLSVPNAIIFDETYYVKDAWTILQHGVEWTWTQFPTANAQIVAGHTPSTSTAPAPRAASTWSSRRSASC